MKQHGNAKKKAQPKRQKKNPALQKSFDERHGVKTYATVAEMVNDKFFSEVIGDANKVSPQMMSKLNLITLKDLAPGDKQFANYYVDMFVDRIERSFGVSATRLKNLKVSEILNYIISAKKKNMAKKEF